jgi:hypothetical protein
MLGARLTADSPVGRQRRIDIPTSGAASEATAQNGNGFQSRLSSKKENKQYAKNRRMVRKLEVVQHAAQSIPAPDGAAARCKAWVGFNQPVSESLVVPFPMVMSQKLMYRFPQRPLAEQDQTL